MHLRTPTSADLPQLTQLNNAAVPAVPATDNDGMAQLLDVSDFAFAVVDEADAGAVRGFVIGMKPGNGYDSENYRFFENRGVDSLYVDRIVVSEASRGQKLGQLLYGKVFELARQEGRAEVTCEVNLDPPNPGSLQFHGRLGFTEVARQATKAGSVHVALLAAPVIAIPD